MKYRILITDEGDRVIERECYEFKCMDGWLELFKYAWVFGVRRQIETEMWPESRISKLVIERVEDEQEG